MFTSIAIHWLETSKITETIFLAVQSKNPHKFAIQISTEEYDAETESNGLGCQLVFTYTEKYPDTAPLVEIENPINFEDDFEGKLLKHINETVSNAHWVCKNGDPQSFKLNNHVVFVQITENLGIEMIFSLVSSAQEWLNVKWDEYKKEEENRAQEKLREFEEAEQVSLVVGRFFYLLLKEIFGPKLTKKNVFFFLTEKIRGNSCDGWNVP